MVLDPLKWLKETSFYEKKKEIIIKTSFLKTIRWYRLFHGIPCLKITKKFLFWNFRRWRIRYFLAKKFIEIWYLLITEKFLYWTFPRWKMRLFFELKSWWTDDIYWFLKSFCFQLFRDGEYSIFWAKELMERWYLLITEKFMFEIFRDGKYGLFLS